MRHLLLLAALLLLTPVLHVHAAPVSVTIGDPARPETLPDALQAAYAGGARHIVVRPGTYVLPAAGHAAFSLNGWKNARVSAYGVTFVQTDAAWMHNVFDLNNCDGVTLAGPTLTRSEVTHYQGRVLAVGTDEGGGAFCDWRPDTGYPVPPADAAAFPGALNIVDARTRLLKLGTCDYYHRPMEARDGGVFRVHFQGAAAPCMPGDWVVGRYQASGAFKVYLNNSTNCTVQDVTLLRNGFAAIREADGGGNHFLHCRWLPGPPPEGATEMPLVCDAADGFHSTGTLPGPDIENCVFQGVLLDDCLAIHGTFFTVKSVAGRVLTVDGTAKTFAPGQPVRISDTAGFFAEATLAAVQEADKTTTLTLDRDAAVPVGAKLSNPNRAGAGYKIINCQLGGTRSRGILAKADSGLIKNNTITGCGEAAISLGPEYFWNEADYVRNVTVQANTITGCGGFGYGGGAIWVHGDGAVGNRHLVIQDNRLVSNYGGGVQIEWADGVALSGNTFTEAVTRPASLPVRSPVRLDNCRSVSLHGNSVRNFPPVLVDVGANVTGLTGNAPSGIRATLAPSAAR